MQKVKIKPYHYVVCPVQQCHQAISHVVKISTVDVFLLSLLQDIFACLSLLYGMFSDLYMVFINFDLIISVADKE